MGTAIGVPFVAQQPRITAAVFGLAGLRPGAAEFEAAARRITIPVEFVFQWEDAVAPRETGIALFNAFASTDKTMHINPGGHMGIPNFEAASWERFYTRHLGTADAPAQLEQAGGGGVARTLPSLRAWGRGRGWRQSGVGRRLRAPR